VCMRTSEEIGIANEAIVFSDCFKCRVKLQTCERQLAGALLSVNAAILCENHHQRVVLV